MIYNKKKNAYHKLECDYEKKGKSKCPVSNIVY